MSGIDTFESLDQAIQRAGGKPKVLEALWDGDTQGWYLCLSLYAEHGVWPLQRTQCHSLGTVTLGTDIRLFSGEVPPWPEAEFVKRFVRQTATKYGLTLYLPSEEPDDDCPRWTARELAIACADCHKLIIPTDSPYLPKDVCYNCHLQREQNARIRRDEPYNAGVSLYQYQAGEYHSLGYSTLFESFAIAPYIDPALLQGGVPNSIHVVTLGPKALAEIQSRLAEALEANLPSYQPAEKDSRRSHFYHFHSISYRSVTYELEIKWHELHREISHLFHGWDAVRRAIAAGACFQLYFKRGITHRDDAFLRFLNYPTPSPKRVDQFVDHYRGTLTEQEVRATLTKLEGLQCVEVQADLVSITPMGSCIL